MCRWRARQRHFAASLLSLLDSFASHLELDAPVALAACCSGIGVDRVRLAEPLDRGDAAGIQTQPWQSETSVSPDSWGYARGDTYKSPDEIVQLLVDVVSKNGNLLLNIGPKADGTIPPQARHILQAVGTWLHANGEAIYGTRPWRRFGEGPTQVVAGTMQDTKTKAYTAADFRFTTKGVVLYAVELGWPANRRAVIHSISPDMQVMSVTLLATGKPVTFTRQVDGLHLDLPAQPAGVHAYAYRIELQGKSPAAGMAS